MALVDPVPSTPSVTAPAASTTAVPHHLEHAKRRRLAEVAGSLKGVTLGRDRILPMGEHLAPLFPDDGLRRGSTVEVSASTTLALTAIAEASKTGSWCAAVGMASLNPVAAAQLGMALDRLVLVPRPGRDWPTVAAALLDVFDVVLVRVPRRVRPPDARRLMARARERGAVLMPVAEHPNAWPVADLRLQRRSDEWHGLGQGHGHLSGRRLEVTAEGRGSASRPRQAPIWLAA